MILTGQSIGDSRTKQALNHSVFLSGPNLRSLDQTSFKHRIPLFIELSPSSDGRVRPCHTEKAPVFSAMCRNEKPAEALRLRPVVMDGFLIPAPAVRNTPLSAWRTGSGRGRPSARISCAPAAGGPASENPLDAAALGAWNRSPTARGKYRAATPRPGRSGHRR